MCKVKLPSQEQLSTWIKYWQSHDLEKLTSKEVDEKILELYRNLGCAGFARDHICETESFFRIRKYENKDLNEISELWEPNADICKSRGRCNAPGVPVLYASKDAFTPLKEMEIEPKDKFWLFEYKAKKNFDLVAIGVGDNNLMVKDDFWGNDKQSINNNKLLWNEFKSFILGEFTKPVIEEGNTEHYYLISEAICRLWLNIDAYYGWSYPSAKTQADSNYAIKQEYIREALDLADGWLLQLMPLEDENITNALKEDGHYYLTMANKNEIEPFYGFPETRPIINFDNKEYVPIILKDLTKPVNDKISWKEHKS